jgi:hypothetical protein
MSCGACGGKNDDDAEMGVKATGGTDASNLNFISWGRTGADWLGI